MLKSKSAKHEINITMIVKHENNLNFADTREIGDEGVGQFSA